MGKITGSSWLAAVKRTLIRSPNHKDHKKSIRRGDDDPDQEDQAKQRGNRRWIFMKSSSNCHHQETVIQHCEPKIENPTDSGAAVESDKQQRHVLAMAVVTTAAAQAAVATAQAAMEVARLARPVPSFLLKKHHLAALCIQTAFRAYLARKALRALKGLVKLQALVRGHNVRKRAKMTLRCMQALVRVQDRVCDQRRRLSYEGSTVSIDSIANSHSNNREKSYASREESSFENDSFHFNYNINAQTVAEMEASLQQKTRENVTFKPQHYSLANAFSRQMMIGGSHSRDTYASEGEAEYRAAGWPISSSRKLRRESNRGRVSSSSCDHTDASATNVNFKTVEIDTSRPYSCSYFSTSNTPPLPHQEQRRSFSVASPDVHRRCEATHSTRSPPKSTNIEAYSISPRCSLPKRDRITNSLPNYMAATASTKARIRSQSAPKQRVLNPDQSNSTARRRLKFPVSEPEVALTSKGLLHNENDHAQHVRVPDLRSNMSSCCTTESISPPISRTDLSRLLR